MTSWIGGTRSAGMITADCDTLESIRSTIKIKQQATDGNLTSHTHHFSSDTAECTSSTEFGNDLDQAVSHMLSIHELFPGDSDNRIDLKDTQLSGRETVDHLSEGQHASMPPTSH